MNRHQKKKSKEKEIAIERITALLHQAEKTVQSHPERSHAYVRLAWRILTRSKATIPSPLKRQFCRKCLHYLKPGITARIRLNKGKKTYYCMNCGSYSRVPYKGSR